MGKPVQDRLTSEKGIRTCESTVLAASIIKTLRSGLTITGALVFPQFTPNVHMVCPIYDDVNGPLFSPVLIRRPPRRGAEEVIIGII